MENQRSAVYWLLEKLHLATISAQTIKMDNLKQKDSYFCHHFSQILGDIFYYLAVNYSHTQITKLFNHPHYHFEPRFQLSRSDQKAPIC